MSCHTNYKNVIFFEGEQCSAVQRVQAQPGEVPRRQHKAAEPRHAEELRADVHAAGQGRHVQKWRDADHRGRHRQQRAVQWQQADQSAHVPQESAAQLVPGHAVRQGQGRLGPGDQARHPVRPGSQEPVRGPERPPNNRALVLGAPGKFELGQRQVIC